MFMTIKGRLAEHAWVLGLVLIYAGLVVIVVAVSTAPTRHKTNTCTWNPSHTVMTCVEEWK